MHSHPHDALSQRAWVRIALWVSLSVLALWVLLHGQSDLYIAPNVRWTLWLAIAVSLVLATIDGYAAYAQHGWPLIPRVHAGSVNWRAASYGLLFAPFAIGLAIPPGVLGANSLSANDSVVTLLPAPALGNPATQIAPFNLLQLQDRLRGGALTVGSPVQVEGFVYHQRGLPMNTWLLVRFITPHCVAEAQPLALAIHFTGRAPPNNVWVRVAGTLNSATLNGRTDARLESTMLTPITIPLDPYLVY